MRSENRNSIGIRNNYITLPCRTYGSSSTRTNQVYKTYRSVEYTELRYGRTGTRIVHVRTAGIRVYIIYTLILYYILVCVRSDHTDTMYMDARIYALRLGLINSCEVIIRLRRRSVYRILCDDEVYTIRE